METKEREKGIKIPIRGNTGKGVERLKMKCGGGKYDTQLTTSAGEKKKGFMNNIHKLAADVTFTHMTDNKGIKKHGEKVVAYMYK